MTKSTSTMVNEESNQMSDVQFLFNKYEEVKQEILSLSKELETAQSLEQIHRKHVDDLECDIRHTRFVINTTIAKCLDKDRDFKPKSKVTKQDLLNALQTISGIVNEGGNRS